MKRTIKALGVIFAVILGATTAQSEQLEVVLVPNHHGQFTPLYRSVEANQPTLALNIGNQGLGNNIVVSNPSQDLVVTKRVDGHGRNIVQYWRAR